MQISHSLSFNVLLEHSKRFIYLTHLFTKNAVEYLYLGQDPQNLKPCCFTKVVKDRNFSDLMSDALSNPKTWSENKHSS